MRCLPSVRPSLSRAFLPFALLAACQSTPSAIDHEAFAARLAELEGNGRLGVAVFDTGTGAVHGRRLDERFAMCSTFKLVLAAMVLERAANGGIALDSRLCVERADLIAHAPVTSAAVDAAFAKGEPSASLTLGELARAAQTTSDNAAANVLLRHLGGPEAFVAFCRTHGDAVTRLDRYEPEMNDVRAGDERDTTTPRAMAQLLAHLLGGAMHGDARAMLRRWMGETETGRNRVRRGLPTDWPAGDKTGTGGGSGVTVKCNDLVWIEPPGRAPLVVVVYFDTGEEGEWPSEAHEAVLAEVGRLVARLR